MAATPEGVNFIRPRSMARKLQREPPAAYAGLCLLLRSAEAP